MLLVGRNFPLLTSLEANDDYESPENSIQIEKDLAYSHVGIKLRVQHNVQETHSKVDTVNVLFGGNELRKNRFT